MRCCPSFRNKPGCFNISAADFLSSGSIASTFSRKSTRRVPRLLAYPLAFEGLHSRHPSMRGETLAKALGYAANCLIEVNIYRQEHQIQLAELICSSIPSSSKNSLDLVPRLRRALGKGPKTSMSCARRSSSAVHVPFRDAVPGNDRCPFTNSII